MPTITLSDATFAKVKAQAEPLVDDADSVVSRVFDFYALHKGADRNSPKPAVGEGREGPVALPVGTRDLTHTRLITARVDGADLDRPDWNSLTRDMHSMARRRLGSFEAVRNASSANIREGRFEENGYRFVAEAGLSVQGCDANNSWEASLRLAKAMNVPITVTLRWHDKEEAAHPGRTGIIEWSPERR